MKPPALIASVFDQFPVVTHAPVSASTTGLADRLERNTFHFVGDSAQTASFVLGCHNVVDHDGKLIPSDPMSLAFAVVLCHKNGLKLPRASAEESSKSSHYIMKMSLYASPDKCLPILIEEDNVKKTRDIRSLVSLERSIASRSFSKADETLLNDLVDSLLSDVWLLCLWFEKDSIALGPIFGEMGTSYASYDLYNEITHWKSFGVRYPVLKQSTYEQKLEDLKSTLELCADETNKIINIKIACFLLHVKVFLKKTQLHKTVEPFAIKNVLDEY